MRNVFKHTIPAALLVAAPFVLAPGAGAQEMEPELQVCTAEVTPLEINVGETAVEVTAQLSQDVGVITELETPEESGLTIASAEDLPAVEMANPEETPEPIEMSAEGNTSAVLWLNTENAEPGTFDIVLKGEQGDCTAEVTTVSPTEPGR